jgi:hypothetical protein
MIEISITDTLVDHARMNYKSHKEGYSEDKIAAMEKEALELEKALREMPMNPELAVSVCSGLIELGLEKGAFPRTSIFHYAALALLRYLREGK